jgi:hypothetical protein
MRTMPTKSLPLSTVAEVFSGQTLKPGQVGLQEGGFHVVQAVDLGDAQSLRVTKALPSATLARVSPESLLRPADLLIRTRGASNQVVFLAGAQVDAVAVSPLLVLRVKAGAGLDPHYLHWLLNSPEVQAQLGREARGTTIRMLSAESIRQLPILLPSLDQQHQIAALAALAEREEALTRDLQTQRRQLLDQVLWQAAQNTSGIPPPGEKAKALGGTNSQGLLNRN